MTTASQTATQLEALKQLGNHAGLKRSASADMDAGMTGHGIKMPRLSGQRTQETVGVKVQLAVLRMKNQQQEPNFDGVWKEVQLVDGLQEQIEDLQAAKDRMELAWYNAVGERATPLKLAGDLVSAFFGLEASGAPTVF
jgi:hypothetical protein